MTNPSKQGLKRIKNDADPKFSFVKIQNPSKQEFKKLIKIIKGTDYCKIKFYLYFKKSID